MMNTEEKLDRDHRYVRYFHRFNHHNIRSDNSDDGRNNLRADRTLMASSGLRNEATRKKIDQLLASGVDLDQVAIFESELYPELMEMDPKCTKVIRRLASCAMENAKKIQE